MTKNCDRFELPPRHFSSCSSSSIHPCPPLARPLDNLSTMLEYKGRNEERFGVRDWRRPWNRSNPYGHADATRWIEGKPRPSIRRTDRRIFPARRGRHPGLAGMKMTGGKGKGVCSFVPCIPGRSSDPSPPAWRSSRRCWARRQRLRPISSRSVLGSRLVSDRIGCVISSPSSSPSPCSSLSAGQKKREHMAHVPQ